MEAYTENRLRMLANGYTPIPAIDKITTFRGWPTVEVTEQEIESWDRIEGMTSSNLRIENGLAVIDFDIPNDQVTQLYDELLDAWPELSDCLMRIGKAPKEAWFFRVDRPYPRLATPVYGSTDEPLMIESWGGETRRQFGAVGWHTEGERRYQWVDGLDPTNVSLEGLPLLERGTVSAIMRFCAQWLDDRFDRIRGDDIEETRPCDVYDLTPDMVFVTRADGELTLDELRGVLGGSGHYYLSASFTGSVTARNTRRCSATEDHHGGVAIWDSMTDITHHEAALEPRSEADVATNVADRLRALGAQLPEREEVPEAAVEPEDRGGEEELPDQFQLDGGRNPYVISNIYNAQLIAETDPVAQEIRFNEFHHRFEIDGMVLGDYNWPSIIRMVQGNDPMYRKMAYKTLKTGIESVSVTERPFHPIREYLRSVAWDGEPRLTSLPGRLGVENAGVYEEQALVRWMISAVARVMQPGCKADHMLILIGEQGIGKSSFFAELGQEWYGEDLPSVTNKDAKEYLRGRWLVEMAELSAMRGKDAEHTKAFLSVMADQYRKSYGTDTGHYPRQCVFAGTSNKREFLTDETGGRRFWPVPVGKVDLDWVREHRDQLWAEAVAAYDAGHVWWFKPDEEPLLEAARAAQEDAYEYDPDTLTIMDVVRRVDEITTKEIYVAAFCMSGDPKAKGPVPRDVAHRISRVMKKGAWSLSKKVRGARYWVRTEGAEPKLADPAKKLDVLAGVTPIKNRRERRKSEE